MLQLHHRNHQPVDWYPYFGALVQDAALAEVENYNYALEGIVQNLASLQVQGCTLASCTVVWRGWRTSSSERRGRKVAVASGWRTSLPGRRGCAAAAERSPMTGLVPPPYGHQTWP